MPVTKKSASTAPDSWLFGVMGSAYGNRNTVFLAIPGCPSALLGGRFLFLGVCQFPSKRVGVAVVTQARDDFIIG